MTKTPTNQGDQPSGARQMLRESLSSPVRSNGRQQSNQPHPSSQTAHGHGEVNKARRELLMAVIAEVLEIVEEDL